MKTLNFTLTILLFLSSVKFIVAQGETDYDKTMISLANDVANRVRAKKKLKVAVWYFHDTFGKKSALGDYIGRDFSIHFTNASDDFEVLDRDHYSSQLKNEHDLQEEGFINPTTAKQLNMLTGADAIVTGTVDVGLHFLRVRIKIINSETGSQLAASLKSIPIDENLKYILDGTGINKKKNGYKGDKPINPNEEVNNPITTSMECEQNKTGDYYFKNETNTSYLIYVNSNNRRRTQYYSNSGTNNFRRKTVTVEAYQTVSVKSLPVGEYNYTMYKNKFVAIGVETIQGDFRVEKCKSLSYSISKYRNVNTNTRSINTSTRTIKANRRIPNTSKKPPKKITVRQILDVVEPLIKRKN